MVIEHSPWILPAAKEVYKHSSNSRLAGKKLETVDLAKRVSALERQITRIAKRA